MSRAQRIELAAALMFGRGDDGGAEKGWRAKLARALGVGVNTVTATLEDGIVGKPFDRKLVPVLRERAIQMRKDADQLETLAAEIEEELESK